MAIDRVKKAWLVCPAAQAPTVPERLARLGLLHVAEAPQGEGVLNALSADTRAAEAHIRRLSESLDILGEFSKSAKDFLSNLIPTPVETTRKELAEALEAVDVEGLHQKAKELAARRAAAQAAAEKAQQRLAALERFRSLDVPVPAEGALRWSQATVWLAPEKQARRLGEPGLVPQDVVLQRLSATGGKALVASVALRAGADAAASRLRELGFEPVAPPRQAATLRAYVAAIEREHRESEAAVAAAKAELAELARLRHQVELVLGHWEGKLETARALGKMAATGRAAVLAGYVRAHDEHRFREAVAREMPEVSLILEEPRAGESIPVSLTNAPIFRPAQFLVEMFGLPSYSAFDPSAFLMLSFVAFYGLCFGDAVYGAVQLALAWALLRRYRAYPGLRNFFALLAWGGVTSIIVGVFTGTWAADIWVPKDANGNADWTQASGLQLALKSLIVMDPLASPLDFLVMALLLGVVNQLWGITMKFIGCWRQGDWKGALFDAGFWYLILPGLCILVAGFFSPAMPGGLGKLGLGLTAAGAVGLVLTQGRGEKSLAGKIIVGLVSLYGIVGSYGCISFVGDTLSYSRLLALALTTSIVGMAVNIIGDIIKGMFASPPIVGIIAFIIVAVVGHLFNLVLSALGAFIHAARLIFVEFFGRFYEPGAQRFAPLGASRGRLRVTD